MISNIPITSFTANSIARMAEQRERDRQLIRVLRRLCYHGSLQAYDEVSGTRRARWARMIGDADEFLRELCTQQTAKGGTR